jgi:hypothetical protein
MNVKIYRIIILPIVLYGCKTWSLTLREEGGLSLFDNRVLRRIYGPKRDEVAGNGGKKLHNLELNDLHFSPNIVRVIKPRRMRWVGHVACIKESRGVYAFWWGNLRERDHLNDYGIDGRISIWIFRKWDVRAWTGSMWLRIGTGGGHL